MLRFRDYPAYWPLCASLLLLASAIAGCSSSSTQEQQGPRDWPCELAAGATDDAVPNYLSKVGCHGDFDALASRPLDASIPGARSGKVVLDLNNFDLNNDSDVLYFQNSQRFQIHHDFVVNALDAAGEHIYAGSLSTFNPEYTLPLDQRHFLLGTVTYYEQPDVWALEIAPYDTSTPAMIETLYRAVRDQAFFGPVLKFHPTSEAVATEAKKLSAAVKVITTDELYTKIDYQPLNLGEAVGRLRIMKAADLATAYVSIRDIVVLDSVPNDISAVAAIVTEDFQTPLSHINVLARTRGTPNMGLRVATTHPKFLPYNGMPVRVTVGAFDWDAVPVSQAEADAWLDDHRPPKVDVPEPDLTVSDLRDIETVTEHTDTSPYVTLDAIKKATRAFGAKASNYSVFSTDPLVPHKPAFAIPGLYYHQFMTENGLFDQVTTWQADPEFETDDALRDSRLAELREKILVSDFNADFKALLKAKLKEVFPDRPVRFRSSTNAEDLDGFPCAGCYDSHTGDPSKFAGDQLAASLAAIRKVYATVWNKRTYDERMIHQMDHRNVAMSLLVHTNFPDEEANGIAITSNIFDATGNAPGFYVNVQYGGEYEVVHPPAGITSDSFLYQYSYPNQPIIYYTHSNILPATQEHVLTSRQVHDLGVALDSLHERFKTAYRPSNLGGWYALEVDLKFDDAENPGEPPALYIKQARPYPAGDSIQAGN